MSFISGISVFCFAASYTVALVLELTRMFFRSGVRGALMLGFAGAGLIAHTLFLAYRADTASAAPLSSAYDWDLLGAWALVVVYLYLTWDHPKTSIGLFLLPLVLALLGLSQYADQQPFAQSRAGQIWGTIHGIFLLLGVVTVSIGFVAGVMYLIQSFRLKHKLPASQGLRLPSLEWLERVNSRAILVSAFMVGIGFASGIVLNMVLHKRRTDELPWTDPIIWRTALMFGWMLAAALFSAVYRPARGGRKVAYLTVASFAFLAISLVVGVLLPSVHGTAAVEKQKADVRKHAARPADFAFGHPDSDFCRLRSAFRDLPSLEFST
jgi:ABC-type uncharacterized transport system permease subunit